jgi:hypothetical protein
MLLAIAAIMAWTGAPGAARRFAFAALAVFTVAGALAIIAARRFNDCREGRTGYSFRVNAAGDQEECPKPVLGLRDPF